MNKSQNLVVFGRIFAGLLLLAAMAWLGLPHSAATDPPKAESR